MKYKSLCRSSAVRLFFSGAAAFMAILMLTVGCTRKAVETGYYLLDYRINPQRSAIKLTKPLPYKVQVTTFRIPRSYDSIRIIARYSSHQINYFRYSLWAVRPQMVIADLLVQQINSYPLFVKCQREFLEERPDFEIGGLIEQIEMYRSEKYAAAHLKMNLEFSYANTGDLVAMHQFDREVPVPPDNMSVFAKALSDIIRDESEVFLQAVITRLQAQADSLNAAGAEIPSQ